MRPEMTDPSEPTSASQESTGASAARARALGLALVVFVGALLFSLPVRDHAYPDDPFGAWEQATLPPVAAVSEPTFLGAGPEGWQPLTDFVNRTLLAPRDHASPSQQAARQHGIHALLHASAAALLALALASLGFSLVEVLFVAGTYALHPLQMEGVAWTAQRGRLLAAVFLGLALVGYARHVRRPGTTTLAWMAVCLLAALVAHPSAAAFPLLIWAIDASHVGLNNGSGKSSSRRRVRERVLLGSLALGLWLFAFFRAEVATGRLLESLASKDGISARAIRALVSLPESLARFAWPRDLGWYHSDSAGLVPWIMAALTLLLALALRRRAPGFLAGVVGFLAATWLASALGRDGSYGGERYTTLALPILAVALVALGRAFFGGQARSLPRDAGPAPWGGPVALFASVAVLTAWGVAAAGHLANWRTPVRINQQALAVDARNWIARTALAYAEEARGRLTSAEHHAREVLRLRPETVAAQRLLGVVALRRSVIDNDRRFEELANAQRAFQATLELDSEDALATLRLGETRQRMGDSISVQEARRLLARAVELRPDLAEAHTRLGMAQLATREIAAAEQSFARVVELEELQRRNDTTRERKPDALCGLGIVAMQSGAMSEARSFFEQALEAEPDYVEARTYLGRILFDEGDLEGARRELTWAFEIHPRFDDALYYLALLDETEGRIERAVDFYERTLEQNPNHVRANVNLAWLYAGAGRLEEARERANHVIERLNPKHPSAHELLGRIAFLEEDWPAALASFEEAAAFEPEVTEHRLNVGLTLLRLERKARARAVFQELRERDADSPEAAFGLGLVLLEEGRVAAARKQLETAAAGRPADPRVLSKLAEVCSLLGDWSCARDHYEAAFALDEQATAIGERLALLLAAAPDEALRDGDRALDLALRLAEQTDREDTAVLEALAAAYANLGRFDEALETQALALALAESGTPSEPPRALASTRARLDDYRNEKPLRLKRVGRDE